MKELVLIFSIILGFHSNATAKPIPDSKTLAEIFSAARIAVGNEKDIAKIRSINAHAVCVGPKGKYTTTIISFRTGKTHFGQTYSYRDTPSNILINGNLVWEKHSEKLSTPFQRLVVRLHEYQMMAFDFQNFFKDFELAGEEEFAGRMSNKVRAKNELGMMMLLYFDKGTNRFSGYVLQIPDSTETVRNVFTEWRKVGKLTLPSTITATDKDGEWLLRFHTITLNKADEKWLDVPPRVADMAELLRLHRQQRTAHLTYDAELFTEMFAENLIQVQRGATISRTKAENLARFRSYFASFKFQEWEDIKPPAVKVSKDGSMATIIVQKRVRGTYKNEKGEDVFENTVFAWIEVWEKIDGKWKVSVVASTEKPADS